MKTIHACNYCGSPRVYVDAYASLNVPEDIRTYDNCYCDDCEGECRTTEVEVADDFDLATGFIGLEELP
jgi:hypothetical protein